MCCNLCCRVYDVFMNDAANNSNALDAAKALVSDKDSLIEALHGLASAAADLNDFDARDAIESAIAEVEG